MKKKEEEARTPQRKAAEKEEEEEEKEEKDEKKRKRRGRERLTINHETTRDSQVACFPSSSSSRLSFSSLILLISNLTLASLSPYLSLPCSFINFLQAVTLAFFFLILFPVVYIYFFPSLLSLMYSSSAIFFLISTFVNFSKY